MTMQNRPLSPHLQIYRWRLTMFLSILHRATGMALAAGTVLIAWWLLAAVTGEQAFLAFHAFTHSLLGQLMMFGWVFSLCYHFFNGLRHLVWDAGCGIEIGKAHRSGQIVLALSAVSSAIVWFCAG